MGRPAYILDLSEDPIVIAAYVAGEGRVCRELDGLVPQQVVIRPHGDGVEVWTGAPGEIGARARQEENVLFEHVSQQLPVIADAAVQRGLITGLWQAMRQQLTALLALHPADSTAAQQDAALSRCDLYLVVPPTFSVAVLDAWRQVLTDSSDRWVLQGQFNAVLCTLAYYLATPVVRDIVTDVPTLVTCMSVRNARDIRLCQAQCAQRDAHWEVKLLHYVQGELRLADVEQALAHVRVCADGTPLWLVHAMEAAVPERLSAALRHAPGRLYQATAETHFHPVQEVKVRGALSLIQGARSAMLGEPVVDVRYAWYLGVESGAGHFTVLLSPEHFSGVTHFPLSQTRTLTVHGPLTRSVRFNLWAGLSTRVADAMPLGHLTLPYERGRGVSRVIVRLTCMLESATSGTATLVLVSPPGSGPVLLEQIPFRLPLMVC